MKLIFIVIYSLFSINVFAQDKLVGVFYYSEIFGHVHSNPSRYSSSITSIGCGQPLKVYGQKDVFGQLWFEVKIADSTGYVLKEHTGISKPECFQTKYPVFLNSINLGVTELYYWGRLYDQYLTGKVSIK